MERNKECILVAKGSDRYAVGDKIEGATIKTIEVDSYNRSVKLEMSDGKTGVVFGVDEAWYQAAVRPRPKNKLGACINHCGNPDCNHGGCVDFENKEATK